MSETYSIVARVPPGVAYAYVADVTRHPEWSPDSMQIQPEAPGPLAVGSRLKAVGNLMGKPNPSTVEVTALDAPKRVAFTSTDGNSKWLHEFTFAASDGGTRIDRTVTVLQGPTMLKVIFPVLHPFVIKPGNMKSLGLLRDRLESLPTA